MTINGLRNTVRYDEDVFRWALVLLETDTVRKTLPYNKIRLLKLFHFFVMAVNLLVCLFVFKILIVSTHLMDFFLTLPAFLALYLIEIPYKDLTASLITEFVETNFSAQELENRTLLQLSVQLEKKYGVAAMVDTICNWTNVFRVIFLVVYIAITKITLFFCGFWTLRAVSRSTVLTAFLKKCG
jgi:hypothetical protein